MTNHDCGLGAAAACPEGGGGERIYLPALAAFQALVIASGVPGNGLTLYILRWKLPQSAFRVLLAGLAVYDLLTCSLTASLDLGLTMGLEGHGGRLAGCKAVTILGNSNALATYVLLLAIAIHRYRAICRPHAWQLSLTAAKAAVVLAPIVTLPVASLGSALSCERRIPVSNASYLLDCAAPENSTGSAVAIVYVASTCLLNLSLTVALAILYFAIIRTLRQTGRLLCKSEAQTSRCPARQPVGMDHAVQEGLGPDEGDLDGDQAGIGDAYEGGVSRASRLWLLVRSTLHMKRMSMELPSPGDCPSPVLTFSKIEHSSSGTNEVRIDFTAEYMPLIRSTSFSGGGEMQEVTTDGADNDPCLRLAGDTLDKHSYRETQTSNLPSPRKSCQSHTELAGTAPQNVDQGTDENEDVTAGTDHCLPLGSQPPRVARLSPEEPHLLSAESCSRHQVSSEGISTTPTKHNIYDVVSEMDGEVDPQSLSCNDTPSARVEGATYGPGAVVTDDVVSPVGDNIMRPKAEGGVSSRGVVSPEGDNLVRPKAEGGVSSRGVMSPKRENLVRPKAEGRSSCRGDDSSSDDAEQGRIPVFGAAGAGAGSRRRRQLDRTLVLQKRRLAMMLAVLAVFVVSFLPAVLANVLHQRMVHLGLDPGAGSTLFSVMLRTVYLSSLCNPLIYGIGDLHFRRQVELVFRRCRDCFQCVLARRREVR